MKEYGLSAETLKGIRQVFQNFREIEEAVLYGSRAMGNYRTGSDIDITFKGKELDLHSLNRISLEMDKLMLPYICDLSIYHNINSKELIDHIRRRGIVLYRNTPSAIQ